MAYRTSSMISWHHMALPKKKCRHDLPISPLYPHKIQHKHCTHWTPLKPQRAEDLCLLGWKWPEFPWPPTASPPSTINSWISGCHQKSWLDWNHQIGEICLQFLFFFRSCYTGNPTKSRKFVVWYTNFEPNYPSHPWITRSSGITIYNVGTRGHGFNMVQPDFFRLENQSIASRPGRNGTSSIEDHPPTF
jgi:hypothetical protein